MANSNKAPKAKWFSSEFPCGTKRQRLFVNGGETPFFIDSNKRLGHRSEGSEHGLYGSGMHPKGIALLLSSGTKLSVLKHRAEQMALAA